MTRLEQAASIDTARQLKRMADSMERIADALAGKQHRRPPDLWESIIPEVREAIGVETQKRGYGND